MYLPPVHRVGRDSREWADLVGKAGRGSGEDRDRDVERGNEGPPFARALSGQAANVSIRS